MRKWYRQLMRSTTTHVRVIIFSCEWLNVLNVWVRVCVYVDKQRPISGTPSCQSDAVRLEMVWVLSADWSKIKTSVP